MSAMTKRVNITTTVAIRNINPPLCGTYKNIVMSTGNILKCLCKRAIVEEILPNGSTIRLNMKNYYLDNGAGLDADLNKIEEEVNPEETVVETPVPAEEVINEPAPIIEPEAPVEDIQPVIEETPIEEHAVEDEEVVEDIVDQETVGENVDENISAENPVVENDQPGNNGYANNKKKKH